MQKKIWLIVLVVIFVSAGIYFYNSQSQSVVLQSDDYHGPPIKNPGECDDARDACLNATVVADEACRLEDGPNHTNLINERCPDPPPLDCVADMLLILEQYCNDQYNAAVAQCHGTHSTCMLIWDVVEDATKRKKLHQDGW